MHNIVIILSLLFIFSNLKSQSFQLSENQSLSITGTSTLHNWKVDVSEVIGWPNTINVNSKLEIIELSAEIISMDGGRGASMNGKIQKAFNSTEFPLVTYVQSEPASANVTDGKVSISSKGVLSMAGTEKEVSFDIIGIIEGSMMTFSGKYPLKMTDFGIEPPSAMFGQIQTDDDVMVVFKIEYIKE